MPGAPVGLRFALSLVKGLFRIIEPFNSSPRPPSLRGREGGAPASGFPAIFEILPVVAGAFWNLFPKRFCGVIWMMTRSPLSFVQREGGRG